MKHRAVALLGLLVFGRKDQSATPGFKLIFVIRELRMEPC